MDSIDKTEHLHFYPDQGKIVSFRPRVVFSGVLNGGKGWSNGRHSHNFCEIMYITAGVGEVIIENKKFVVKTGDIIVYNTGVFHSESCVSGKMSILFFAIDNLHISGMDSGCIVPVNAIPVIEAGSYDSVFENFLSIMVNELNQKKAHYKAISTHIATLFCYYILRMYNINIENPTQADVCHNAKQYIDIYYQTDINLDTIANSFYISKYYFDRLFKENIGLTPMKYLMSVRVSAAKNLLEKTDMPVTKIAQAVGYISAPTFSRVFKNAENITPTEYRNNNRGRRT